MVYYKDRHIAIRDMTQSDVATLFSWWINKDLNEHDPRPMPTDTASLIDECIRFCSVFQNEMVNENPARNQYRYFMITDALDHLIGFVNLFGYNEELNEAELGVTIGDKAYWRKGIAYTGCKAVIDYAFNTLKYNRLYIETGATNIPAQRLFQKLGFVHSKDSIEENGFKWVIMDATNTQ